MSNNPLLENSGLPRFNTIKAQHAESAIDATLADNRQQIENILHAGQNDWDHLIAPLEALSERLTRVWSPISHINAVINSDELRQAYNACLAKISAYSTEIGQHNALFKAYTALAEGDDFAQLDTAQRQLINNALRDFRLSGIALNDEDKSRYKDIMLKLSALNAKFEENLLDATNAWTLHFDTEEPLAGLPESAKAIARQAAQRTQKKGWMITLEIPSYIAVSTYADDRALRQQIYTAYVTRASDEGPHAGQWDNSANMEEILALRHEAALLLKFSNYAERSLATKMATDTRQVIDFLQDLAERSLSMARQELAELKDFAQQRNGLETLEAWDIAYYSEKLRQEKFAISQEQLKPYFPENKVVDGMFAVVKRLYGLDIKERFDIETWHTDVRFFDLFDRDQQLRGQFYLDLYARPHKRGGAWMDECIIRQRNASGLQTPVAYLTCNFSPPIAADPALFTHNEVITLFHEFGHGLHHMLTQIDYPGVSGINGVAWDAVELPSQFMENWCWEKEALALFSAHYQSGESLPDALFDKLIAAKNFQSGMQMVRQAELALFDFRIHAEYDPALGPRIQEILNEVRAQVAVVLPPAFNRFPHSFAHIFAGGYAAGYYSYKWAEVLSSDAFSLFEERGIFDSDTGRHFMTSILEQGGSQEPLELFKNFRGREPQIDALLRHSGITQ